MKEANAPTIKQKFLIEADGYNRIRIAWIRLKAEDKSYIKFITSVAQVISETEKIKKLYKKGVKI